MNVLIDTAPLHNQNAARGVGRYTRELVNAMKTVHHPSMAIFTTAEDTQQIDLVHYTFFDFFFMTLPLFRRHKTIVTIHDTIPLQFPKHYKPGIKGSIRFLFQQVAVRTVDHIITDSSVSKRDIHEQLHIPLEKISVVPLAASADLTHKAQPTVEAIRKKFDVPKKYLLYVGDINYSKNIPFLLRLMKNLPVPLVMVGKQMKNTSIQEGKEIADFIVSEHMEDLIILLDHVETNEELSALYSGAIAYIQPSLYEGFGFPILEAMQCKCPVICSVGGSLPEVAGDAALYFHPSDSQSAINAIRKVIHMSGDERLALIHKGIARAQLFSWEKTARETLDVYEKVGKTVQ
ncbi:hypothetical protein C5B42_04970 [Candidatus Cerribacteria bacterium 'Amazon FNV 2010 28 9']|uniref:Glycosyltransferase family 1 protein n=1 Tax=Candidatus Cerribacteria bacterium 'Amazon FNV 2010 28 9' TaxID=2081795 RepID=A0A317JSP2_9BACT|nr:MAG: hypothetical protein C5B42_04970 [Candidatus Cerribacteria bacterium 'Amazon FNV 2010 28 9']